MKIKIIKNYTAEILILRLCFELWDSLVDNSIHTESNQYARLVK